MRELRVSRKKFLQELNQKLSITDANTIELALSKFAEQEGKKILVIDHFEYLFEENHDKAFNFDFFSQLNSFKNSSDVSLIVVSLHNYKHEPFYKNGELTTSPLDIYIEQITSLMQIEIENELKRNIDEKLGFELLANLIIGKDKPYDFIKFIIKEIKFGNYNSEYFLEKNFDRWDKKFHQTNRVLWYLWLWKHLKKINPKTLMSFLKEVVSWAKRKD